MWGNAANCYAYACNCKVPANGLRGAAVPGGYADQGVFPLAGELLPHYANRLIQGVLLDATRNNLTHAIVSTDIGILPDSGSGYIIGMVANGVGFHFFRRNRFTHLWSWKDGIPSDKETSIHHIALGNNQVREMDDMMFIRAIKTAKQNYVPNWANMDFVAYFGLGDINGMTVAGISADNNVMP